MGAPQQGDLWGLETRGWLHSQPQAQDALPIAHAVQRSDKLPLLEGQEASPALAELADLLMSAA